ncbi:ABC transporter substrate-binding protein [Pigmentiphaga sp. GD03639]|uniref:ABC transporter substrate-binding protein n=1 Tax=unclassified Pigmentiphaga TaxID=2626614 RepID=UPI000B412B9B|nr:MULTISPECIES: ABC transporter substrate-binding protein [unclassified Pigmentiphaga]MDH2239830.1 ABC transporter substrate-binding protein [Pigmentiphaga sp. GD03639]OVZ59850.1 4,5-dihydroxyphthalate decarboxylase [Pigmentiphaga sp. NML030171]
MTSKQPLPLKIAIATYGHTAALKRGDVPIEGVQPDFVEIKPIIAAFRRMVRDVEFDVCEMAPATYMIAREAGAPFKALPVFIFRRFHHAGLVYRDDAGIREPRDLEGKRAGVRAYSVTTGIWTRGILTNDYGVDNDRITWVVDDEEHVSSLQLPPNVEQAKDGKSLVDLMASGYLSAAFTDNAGIGRAGAPADGWQAGGRIKPPEYLEMFPDAERLEAEWYRKTGIYPVHGLITVKDEVLARHPWVGKALYDAFLASKNIYLRQLAAGESVSDKDEHYRAMGRIVGDPLPYGIEANRPSIEAMMHYCHQQGLLKKRYAVDDMFIDVGA